MSNRQVHVQDADSVGFRRFYNLPSDEALGYPRFTSFLDRESFIRNRMLQAPEFLLGLEILMARDNENAQDGPPGPADDEGNDLPNEGMKNGNAQRVLPKVLQLADHEKLSEIVFVGSSTAFFSPKRGDLIIYPPGKNKILPQKGYLASYSDCKAHRFEHGELLVRIGQYHQAGSSLYVHQPYRNLELHQYNMDRRWKYLGSQVAMTNTEIPDVASSPGKYLQVGAQIASLDRFRPLVPRRGDIIIKREAWDATFFHQENFRRSMVKWHRDRQITWRPNDLLIRLFVDKEKVPPYSNLDSNAAPDPGDHSACVMHGTCTASHPPPSCGFAELYECRLGVVEWVYWGRTKLLFDIPVQNAPEDRDSHLNYYVADDGQLSDFCLEEDVSKALM